MVTTKQKPIVDTEKIMKKKLNKLKYNEARLKLKVHIQIAPIFSNSNIEFGDRQHWA